MYYYKYNIDKFNVATRHLTRVERSLYRDAIDVYYKQEKPLDSDLKKLSRVVLANTEEEKQALIVVLEEFFYLTDDGYINDHCEEVLSEYRDTTDGKAFAGQVSATTKKINKLERTYMKIVKDFVAISNIASAEHSINECLTSVQQVLNGCSASVQQNFNTKATHSQLTNKLNNLLTNKLNKTKEKKQTKKKSPLADFDSVKHFDEFWKAWPKRGDNKKTTNAKFNIKCKTEEQFAKIMEGLNNHIPKYAATENKFIPSATTWLNQERWNDEVFIESLPAIANGKPKKKTMFEQDMEAFLDE